MRPLASERRKIEPWRDRHVADIRVFRCDQHQAIAEKVFARVVLNEIVFAET
jgi:hypothetical protein